ncbi:MAG: hypothetical protein IJM44_01935 [Ruminococcus sp.]|nr:hypothetical protein [Ruminococcus sp.]
MRTNNAQGRNLCMAITGYLVVKAIINMTLAGGLNIGAIILALVLGAAMFTGLQFVNYGAAAYLLVVAVVYLPGNISNIGSNWIYLLEGLIDIGCAAALCTVPAIKEHFTNKWSEIGSLFGK